MAFHLDQPAGIDPCVDVVFLELFGARRDFRTDVRKNALYRGRLDAERVEATRQEEMEAALAREEAALAREEAALAREKAALAEVARLQKELADRRE